MRIACLISGRATKYEECLLPLLENHNHDINKIDLFMSINDDNDNCEYYNVLKVKLNKYLADIEIKKYNLPENFNYVYDPTNPMFPCQKINNKWMPYNCLSMYYNDLNAFNMAVSYAEKNNFNYDIFLKWRADIISTEFPSFNKCDENILYSVIPECYFQTPEPSLYPYVWIISDAIAYGNKFIMSIYCKTYEFALKHNKESNGKYPIHFENTLTESIVSSNIRYEKFEYNYSLHKDRRMFDKNWTINNNICNDITCNDEACNDNRLIHSSRHINNSIKYRSILSWKL